MSKQFFIKIFIAVVLVNSYSCKEKLPDSTLDDFSPTWAAPILQATIELEDAIQPDDSLIFADEDQFLRIAYRKDSVFSYSVEELVDMPAQEPVNEQYKLGEVVLGNFGPIDANLRLDSILSKVDTTIANAIIALNGTHAPIPAFAIQQPDSMSFDEVDDFAEVTFSSGSIFLTVTNELPFSINDLELSLQSEIDGNYEVAGNISINEILPGNSETREIDLSGKRLSYKLKAVATSLSTLGTGGNPVFIDLGLGLEIELYTENLKVIHGLAKIPEQVFTQDTTYFDFEMPDNEKLIEVHTLHARFNYSVETNITAPIQAILRFPYITRNGNPVQHVISLNQNNQDSYIDLSNSIFDLSLGEDSGYNQLMLEYEVNLFSTNNYIEFDSSHSISIELSLEELDFSLVVGYIGQKEIVVDPDTIDLNIDVLSNISGGFELTDPSIKVNVINSVGIPARFLIDLKAEAADGDTALLEANQIDFPAPDLPGIEVEEDILFNNTISNIIEIISLPPELLYFGGRITTNPDGETPGEPTNFVTNKSRICLGVDFDLPFELKTTKLAFADTIELSIGEGGILGSDSEFEEIKSADLKISAWNGFPFDCSLNIYFRDSVMDINLDSIKADFLESGIVDQNGRVVEPSLSNTIISIDHQRISNIESSNQIIIEAGMETFNNGDVPVKLYLDYYISLSLAGKVSAVYEIDNE